MDINDVNPFVEASDVDAPKFLWKGYSERLTANISISLIEGDNPLDKIAGTLSSDRTAFAVVVFTASNFHLASFVADAPTATLAEEVKSGKLIEDIEDIAAEFIQKIAMSQRQDATLN